jgi:hypothetical protein
MVSPAGHHPQRFSAGWMTVGIFYYSCRPLDWSKNKK